MNTETRAAVYLYTFLDNLYRSGVEHMVISPGSRSTPLAMTAAKLGKMKLWIHVDERSAAFYALGMAKTLRKPVAILCTSGTAAANYLPAVVEAFYSRVPLVVLTADRPHELRDVGASQTINQIDLYGKHVKWFIDVAIPEGEATMLSYIKNMARRAATLAKADPAGPVHLNFPLREPLVPDFSILENSLSMDRPSAPFHPQEEVKKTEVIDGLTLLSDHQLNQLADYILSHSKGVIVCGAGEVGEEPEAVITLAEQLRFPLLADPLSNLRSMGRTKEIVIDSYDSFLRSEAMKEYLKPDLIIRLGPMPVSKPFLQYIQRHEDTHHIIIDGGRGWRDPVHLEANMIFADPQHICSSLVKTIAGRNKGSKTEGQNRWLQRWQTINRLTRETINREMGGIETLFEGRLFAELGALMPDNSLLYVGNSMPVRDLDSFFPSVNKRIRMMANRGAAGIDGLVSSALGASSVVTAPVVLVIGDLSFYHDLNGLLPAKLYALNLTIVLVNNDGGGIFSFLPQADHPQYFETLFGTPLGLDFQHAARLYGATFHRVRSWAEFREVFSTSLQTEGLKIIELSSDRKENVQLHRQIWKRVDEKLKETLAD